MKNVQNKKICCQIGTLSSELTNQSNTAKPFKCLKVYISAAEESVLICLPQVILNSAALPPAFKVIMQPARSPHWPNSPPVLSAPAPSVLRWRWHSFPQARLRSSAAGSARHFPIVPSVTDPVCSLES